MEEDKDDKLQKMGGVTSIGNSWIICRSQSHGGRVYYFNTLTGNAVWNLSDAEMKKAQLQTMSIDDAGDTNIQNCPEPTEPPVDIPLCTGVSQPPPRGAKIYNKQIINNQYSKPYTVSPFVSQQCHCSNINHICDGTMNVLPTPVFNPNMWTVPPPHPLFLTPAMPALPNNPFHQPPQNALPTSFQVRNTFANKGPYHLQGHTNTPQYRNFNARTNQRFSRNFENKPSQDLRNVLSARRKVVMDANSDARQHETSVENEKVQDIASIGENDLYPSDIDDDWLEANAVEYKSRLTVSVSSLQRLACGAVDQDRWFIVVSAIVLLNHLKVIASLANSDERLHVIAPMGVRRGLRSATAGAGAVARRARRANQWAAQQANKVPADLKSIDGSLSKTCLDLVQRNYYVIHLTDDSDLQKNQIEIHNIGDSVPIFTMSELKEYLVQNTAPSVMPRPNITVTLLPDDDGEGKQESLPGRPSSPQLKEEDLTPPTNTTNTLNTDSIEPQSQKTNETEQKKSPKKQTANACVQTDFFLPTLTQCSSSLNSTTDVMDIDHTFKIDILMESDSSKDETTGAKKIKLNRNVSLKKEDSVKKPSFKWRKRRVPTNSTLSDNMETNKQETSVFSPIATQPNDNAVDYGVKSLETPKEITQAMSQQDENDIVMFKVTGDQMDDYLSKGSDEWLSRFVQIMEEALTQILHHEPCSDASFPPPWSIQEATVCIKEKFKHNSNIVFASYTFNTILDELSDSRGKIHPNMDPARFMEMYSYGVNLIEALQSEVKDNEDIQIALESLSKLLFDIRNPNVEGTQVFPDSFVYEQVSPSADVTESEKYDEPNDFPTAPEKTKLSSPKKPAQESVEKVSPRKYNLRSAEKKKPECVKKTANESSFFTGLGLKKNIFVDGAAIKVSFNNSQITAPALEDHENEQKCEQPKTQPQITRNFAKCPEFEEKLKEKFCQFDQEEFAEDKNCSGNGFYLEEDYDGSCGNEADIKRSPSSGDFDTSAVFNWFVERTVCPMNKVLKEIHKFCLDASEDLKQKNSMQQESKMNLFEKTAKLSVQLGGLCKNLNSILQRKDTKSKFREMMKVLEINDFVLTESQASIYKTIIEKFLEQAGILLQSVNLIATEVMDS